MITFETLKGSADYEIVAVFRERVYYQDEIDVFRFYRYGGVLTKVQFNDYIDKIREITLYDTGVKVSYGDQLLTLSTCSYHAENGRFIVVARSLFPENGDRMLCSPFPTKVH